MSFRIIKVSVLTFLFILTGSLCATAEESNQNYPERLKRKDSFLGIHFDFHAGHDCKEVGKNVTPEMIERIIDQVHPDYIQCDCKGHPGISSYPTKVGNPAPGFVRDQLKIWREVTARRGVALYMHYSGVWDNEAIKHHPEWARIDGKLTVNLVNTGGAHENDKIFVIDEIPPVGPLSVTIRSKEKPERVYLESGGIDISYDYSEGIIKLTVPRVEIHEIIVVY